MEKLYKDLLINKYEQNSCTPEEYQEVIGWFMTEEGQTYLSEKIEEDLQSESVIFPADPLRAERIYSRIVTEVAPDQVSVTKSSKLFGGFSINRWLSVAAIWIAILFAGALGFYHFRGPQLITYQTGYGKIRTITLPDQSVVALNANSQLQYRPNWNENTPREVWLKGEAFFSVTHQKNRQRFLVHTSHRYNVEVLGTKFNVLDRLNQFQVVLNSGKIRLSNEKSTTKQALVTMKPGQLIELKHSNQLQLKRVVNTQLYSSWKNRLLQLDQANLADIARILKDSYDLNLEVSDSTLLKNHISGSVPMDNQDILIDGISQLFHIRMIRDNNNITIQH